MAGTAGSSRREVSVSNSKNNSRPATSRRTVVTGIGLLAGLIAFQVSWHLALDHDAAFTRALRKVYLYSQFARTYGKPLVAPLVDLAFPAVVAGVLFGSLVKPTSRSKAMWFSVSVGILLASLQHLYPRLVSYELWWLSSSPASTWIALVVGGAFSALLCLFVTRVKSSGPDDG